MKIWAIANQKGGVGKTTTAVTLGGLLAQQGYRVLLVDTDPHGSLTSYFRYSPDDLTVSVYSLFENSEIDPCLIIKPTRFERLQLWPASMALATLDRQLGAQSGKGLVLQQALQQMGDKYDYVLIDCPPMLGVLMINALAACDHLIMPVQTEFLALKGLERMVRTLAMVTQSRNMSLPYTIMPTMFDRRTRASLDALKQLRRNYGDELWQRVIPVDTLFRQASQVGVPLSMVEPQAKGVNAYRRLLDDLFLAFSVDEEAIA